MLTRIRFERFLTWLS